MRIFKFNALFWASAVVSVLVAGCNDPKKPSETNFRKALDDKLAVFNKSCFARVSSDNGLFWLGTGGAGGLTMGCSKNECAPLEGAGLVELAGVNYPGLFSNRPAYRITEAGKKYLIPNLKNPTGDSYFCFAHATVDKIVRWSEPTDMLGTTLSEVAYTFKFDGVPTWAQASDIQKSIPAVRSAIEAQGREHKLTARLFNDGWRVE